MKTVKYLVAFAVLLFSASFLFACGGGGGERTVTVVFRRMDGLTVLNTEEVQAKVGEDVYFDVGIDRDTCFLGAKGGGEYLPDEGRVVVRGVLFPTTVDISIGKRDECFQTKAVCQSLGGTVSCLTGNEWTRLGQTASVTFSATANEGYGFYAWTVGGYIGNGGVAVSKSPKVSFEATQTTIYYANFLENAEHALRYDPNGGGLASGKSFLIIEDGYDPVWACRQVLHEDGTFVKEGYYPVGYSTEPVLFEDYDSVNDIPGFVNMGGSFIADGTVDLYVVWAKESPASDFLFSGGTVTGYVGHDTDVVIPASIGGVEVTRIAAGAFENAGIRRVTIPKTVTKIENEAFLDCAGLSEVVFFDTLVDVTDQSFSGCDELRTIVLGAARLPRFADGLEGSYAIKYNQLRAGANSGKPRIIVASGSSSLYGLASDQLEERLGGKYNVLNFGTNAGHTVLLFLDVIANYVGEGDVVVHAPEYTMGAARGDNGIAVKTIRGFEQSFDIFREVDMRNYYGFFDAFHEFQTGPDFNAAGRKEGFPYHKAAGLTEKGDLDWNPTGTTADHFGGSASLDPTRTLSNETVRNLERVAGKIESTGASLVMSFAPYDVNLFGTRPSAGDCEIFTDYYRKNLSFPVISDVGDYIYDHNLFYNSSYHPNVDGRELRTDNLADDLLLYLAGQKGGK